MGSLGLPATAMAVRSAFALLCFALLCGLAASSVVQSETETELKEGEAAGNQVLVEQALESRVARGSKQGKKSEPCGPKNSKKCRRESGNDKKIKNGKTKKNRNRKRGNGNRKTKGKGKGKGNRKSKVKGNRKGKGNKK